MKKVFVDLHVIQSVPPSCLNRDDTGSPKTAMYGGARRARVSSQAWKRAMRLMFKEHINESELGVRTLRVFSMVADEIQRMDASINREDALNKAKSALEKVKVKAVAKKDAEIQVAALFFLSTQQVKNLASLALGENDKETEKEIVKLFKETNSVDIALFGRMVADNPLLNCDASAQVAHAISTHRIENEYDYFTAIDDNPEEDKDNAGAGMIGTVEYNSSTLYRYANVAAHELSGQLANDTGMFENAVREFTRAFICSIPKGKQNTFAAHTVPDAVLVSIRTDRPLNLAGAFETPIRGEGITASSAKALEAYARDIYADFNIEPAKSFVVGKYLSGLGDRLPLNDMLEQLTKTVSGMLA